MLSKQILEERLYNDLTWVHILMFGRYFSGGCFEIYLVECTSILEAGVAVGTIACGATQERKVSDIAPCSGNSCVHVKP